MVVLSSYLLVFYGCWVGELDEMMIKGVGGV